MSNVNLTISPVVAAVTVSPVQPAVTISGVTSIPSGPVGGDLAGSLPNPTVDGRRCRSGAATTPTDRQFLRWNDALSQWEPATVTGGSGTVTSITAGTGLTGGTITSSGTIAADIGTGATQVAAGNHSHTLSGDVTGSLGSTSIPTNSVGLTKLAQIGNARLLGNSSGVTGNVQQIAVSSPLGFNGVSGNLEFNAPGSDGGVYFRSAGAVTTSTDFLFDDGNDRIVLTNVNPDTLWITAATMTAFSGYTIDIRDQSMTIGDAFGTGNGTLFTINDAASEIAAVATTVDFGSATLTCGQLDFSTHGEYIRNTVNGRVDIMPAPHPSGDFGVYFDLTSSNFYAKIGTIDSTGAFNTNAGFQFDNTIAVVAGKSADFGNTGGLVTYWASGANPGAWHFAPFIGSGHAGSLILVSQSGNGSANRRPATAHTDPTLYIYAAGSANASHYLRANHNGTNATIESGAGKAVVKAASVVRIEGPSGGFDLPATAGSNGQVLTTDGTNASWATPTGGGVAFDEVMRIAFIGI